MGPLLIKQVLGQGTFLLSNLLRNVFPKPINGFRLKPFVGENPMHAKVAVRLISLIGHTPNTIQNLSLCVDSFHANKSFHLERRDRFDIFAHTFPLKICYHSNHWF